MVSSEFYFNVHTPSEPTSGGIVAMNRLFVLGAFVFFALSNMFFATYDYHVLVGFFFLVLSAAQFYSKPRTDSERTPKLRVAEQILRDKDGAPFGSIETHPNGIQVARDKYGAPVGEYDPKSNTTRDKSGAPV